MTAEEFDKLPEEEGRRYELLDGELIEVPSATPSHNDVRDELLTILRNWLKERRSGKALSDTEFAIGISSRFKPDIAVLLGGKWAQVDRRKVPVVIIPDIVVEIISPSENAYTLHRKIASYLNAGVIEVWEVYHETQDMRIHTGGGVRPLRASDTLTSPLLPGWSQPLEPLFRSE